MSPWLELKRKHTEEVKTLLMTYNHLTITEAARAIGIGSNTLRTWSFRLGVSFAKRYGDTTAIETDQTKIQNQFISLAKIPW